MAPSNPYFAAAYCGARALPRTITVEPMLTMLPCPWSSIRLPNSWMHAMVPLMSTASTWSIDSSVMSRQDICSRATSPTLFTSTSTPPSCWNAASAIAATWAHSTISACSRTASAPSARTRSAVFCAPADERR